MGGRRWWKEVGGAAGQEAAEREAGRMRGEGVAGEAEAPVAGLRRRAGRSNANRKSSFNHRTVFFAYLNVGSFFRRNRHSDYDGAIMVQQPPVLRDIR